MEAGTLLVPPATGYSEEGYAQQGILLGLIGTYRAIPLGSSLGGVTLPDGWSFAAVVPHFVGYEIKTVETDYQKQMKFFSGPPMSAFIGSLYAGTVFVNNREFQSGSAVVGLPNLQNWQFIDGVSVAELDTGRAGTYRIDVFELERYKVNFHVEDPYRGFFARYFPAAVFGTSILIAVGFRSGTFNFTTTQEVAPRHFHFIMLPTSFGMEDFFSYINHTAIIGASSETPIYWSNRFFGSLWVRVVGSKETHLFTDDRYQYFQGALEYPGWLDCIGVMKVGSVRVYASPETWDYRWDRYNPQWLWWPAWAFVVGSVLLLGTTKLLGIRTGIMLPHGCVVGYLAEDTALSLYAVGNYPSGSMLVGQACIARPVELRWYPQTQRVPEFVIDRIHEFVNKPSFVVLTDECDTPFVAHPDELQSESNELTLSFVRSLGTPLGFNSNYRASDSSAWFKFEYRPLEYMGLSGTFYCYLEPMSDFYFSHDNIPGYYAMAHRHIPLIPTYPTINPEDWALRYGRYDPVLLVWRWPDGNFRDSAWRLYWQPGPAFQTQPDRLYRVNYPKARYYYDCWYRSPIMGSIVVDPQRGTELVLFLGYDGALEISFHSAGTFELQPQVDYYDWRQLPIQIEHALVIEEIVTAFGKRYATHKVIRKNVLKDLLRLLIPDLQFFRVRRYGSQYPPPEELGYGLAPEVYVLPAAVWWIGARDPFYIAPPYALFPKSFLGEGFLVGSAPKIILGAHKCYFQSIYVEYAWLNFIHFPIDLNNPVIFEPDRIYYYSHEHGSDELQRRIAYVLDSLTVGKLLAVNPEVNVLKSSKSYAHPGYLASDSYSYGSTILSPSIHPAPANVVSLGQLAHLGTLLEFLGTYKLRLYDPAEKFFLFHNELYPAVALFGTMEAIAIFKGQDTTIFSDFIKQVFQHDPNKALSYLQHTYARFREPALMYPTIWRYDNPYNTELPVEVLDIEVEPKRRIWYQPPPLPVATSYYPIANYLELGSVSWRVWRSSQRFARLLYSHAGWIHSLPAGVLLRNPNIMEAIIKTGSMLGLDYEVTLMRKITTMGNAVVSVYPRFAVINGIRIIPYFTQDGGRCPLWHGEPIVGVDAFPLSEGEVRIFVYTVAGVYSFSLSIHGVFDWQLEPIPIWFNVLKG